jgi:DeoR/GlpR family transcriptional regulator of sugar metabolism
VRAAFQPDDGEVAALPARRNASQLRYNSAPERRERILDVVKAMGYSSVAELGERFGVSEMTVRRDLGKLEEQGLVRVVHGGVSAVTDLLAPVEFQFRTHHHMAAKRAIAAHAATMVESGSVIALDAGTTVLELARRVPSGRNLTVVTHSLPAMSAVARRDGVRLIGLAGTYEPDLQVFAGQLALAPLSQLHVQTLFLATSSIWDGAMRATNSHEVEMKQALLRVADRVVLLADSSKFEYSSLMMVADLSTVTTLVTDDGLPAAARARVRAAGVELVTVPLAGNGAA